MRGLLTTWILLTLATGCDWSYNREASPLPEVPTPVLPPPTPTPDSSASGLSPELELEELRLVVKTLAEENRRLKALLAERPATAAPTPKPVSTVAPTPRSEAPATDNPDRPTVMYVNPNWHYLVINQGSDQGFAVSGQVEIMRQGAPIATAVITEVKPGQAVAEISLPSLESSGLYPRENDGVRPR